MPHGDATWQHADTGADEGEIPMTGPARPEREPPSPRPSRTRLRPSSSGQHATDAAAWATRPGRRSDDPRSVGRQPGAVSSGEIFGMLRRRFATLLVSFLICLAAAFAALSVAAKQYDAVSAVKVSPLTAVGDTGATKDLSTITESAIVTSTAVATRAAALLHFRGTVEALLGNVSASSPLNSQLIYITYAAGDPRNAATGANAFASAYLAYRKSVAQANINDQIKTLTDQVSTLQKRLTALPAGAQQRERANLQSEIDKFNGQVYTATTTVIVPGQVVGVAQPPTTPSSPKKILYVAGGLLGGLIVGVGSAVVRDRRDDLIHGTVDLEDAVGAPALATVKTGRRRSKVPVVPASTSAVVNTGREIDAYRTVATKLRTPVTGRDSNSFVLVRAGRAGEEHAPANLAAMFARQGVQAALVTTERGLKHLEAFFGDEKVPASIDEGVAPVPSVPNLWVLSLGPEDEMDSTISIQRTMIDDILVQVDVVLLDAVNLELPSSVLALARMTDTAVVVAVDGRTTHREVARSIRELDQVGAAPVGIVLFSQRRSVRWRLRHRRSKG